MCTKVAIAALSVKELAEQFSLTPPFRAKQVYGWIAKGVTSFEQMTNLDKASRQKLEERAVLRSSRVSKELRDEDGTLKLQITLCDGLAIETVLLTDQDNRKTACVSCQAGCAMHCAFCQTGTLGLARNLTASEIVEEFLFLEERAGKLDNIVFMGMGEPMQNLEAIRKALSVLTDPEGRALSSRRITISTCGITKGIYDLADNGPQVRLAVSLTTANENLRKSLMPVTNGNSLGELKKAIAYFSQKTQKRVTLEAALMAGVNTDDDFAQELIDFASGLDVHVNLIPWNPVGSLPFKTPSRNESMHFMHLIQKAGIPVTLRLKRGTNVNAACGQLGATGMSRQS